MASPIFHKLHAARKNPGLFDHIEQQDNASGPTTTLQTLRDFRNKHIYITLTCLKCKAQGTPEADQDTPIPHLIFTCPQCQSHAIAQDISTSPKDTGVTFIGTTKAPKDTDTENPARNLE